MTAKQTLLISVITLVTVTNVIAVAYGLYMTHSSSTHAKTSIVATAKIQSSKIVSADATKIGIQKSEGKYDFQTTVSSKQTIGDIGRLALITSPTGVNFVSALSSTTKLDGKLNSGWSTKDLAVDRLWEPGGCASKPTYFLNNRYIFIDDGKNQPTDKYSSYIIYDITAGTYRYFGGANFTDQQGQKEKILKVADENDQPVFYLDVPDVKGPLVGSSTFKHARGSEAGYVIRRVINAADLTYKDYKLPYSMPVSAPYYFTDYGNSGPMFTADGSGQQYEGTVANNQITVAAYQVPTVPATTKIAQPAIEKELSPLLAQQLPAFLLLADGSKAPNNDFTITPLGTSGPVQMLVAQAPAEGSETPVVYNATTKSIDAATNQAILDFTSFVPLGVF